MSPLTTVLRALTKEELEASIKFYTTEGNHHFANGIQSVDGKGR